jgi:hypothetical protein
VGLPPMPDGRGSRLTPKRRQALEQGLRTELPAVLRASAPPFDLDRMLQRFARMW